MRVVQPGVLSALLAGAGFGAFLASCSAGTQAAEAPLPAPAAPVAQPRSEPVPGSEKPVSIGEPSRASAPLVVPERVASRPAPRRRIASGLRNPRGLLPTPSGLLVAAAGNGDPANPNSGSLLRLVDRNADGDYDDPDERKVLLDRQPSTNIVGIVRRDEVFGMADVAEGGGETLATLAFFGGPSTVYRVQGDTVVATGTIHGNLNDIAFDARRGEWFAVSSSSDEILRFSPGGRGDRLVKLPPLERGQDPVPGYLQPDAAGPGMLVTLFSGSTKGEAGGDGTELELRAGAIVRVDPATGAFEPVVTGLTAPTDLVGLPDGTLYVLEFCDSFVEPFGSRAEFAGAARHGGFRRYSGRLLRIDRATGGVLEVASGLDGPTNLSLDGKRLLVSQGMGTPGRLIPTPSGARPLEGFIEAIGIE